MKKLLRPSCLAFYLLVTLVFFVFGLTFAAIIEAGKNQGLAGGAIVLGYGVLFGCLALIVSIFIAYRINPKILVRINWGLLILLLGAFAIAYFKYKTQASEDKAIPSPSKKTTAPANGRIAMLANPSTIQSSAIADSDMGLGLFSPDFYKDSVLYFYGNINLEKSVAAHVAHDSITFKTNEYDQIEIATAPPWLAPHYLKLDYDIFYFRLKSVGRDFAEIVGNEQTNQTTYVHKASGDILFWPQFLLKVHTVEFISGKAQQIKIKPLDQASNNNTSYKFMKPLSIQQNWMLVELQNANFSPVGKGWIKWKFEGELLISYNLLS